MTITISINTELSKEQIEEIVSEAAHKMEVAIWESYYDTNYLGELTIGDSDISFHVDNNNN